MSHKWKESRPSKHPVYSIWYGAKSRCHNPNHPKYIDYGGRGLTMQDSWRENCEEFFRYVESLPDYDNRIENRLSLDRIDNSVGYHEGNLRWAGNGQQMKNKRRSWQARRDRKEFLAKNMQDSAKEVEETLRTHKFILEL